jgi:hypothetical protein
MANIRRERLHADVDGSFVVFLVGMRINRVRALRQWLRVARAAPRMVRELRADDASGLLGSRTLVGWRTITIVQYWESVDALQSYARAEGREHLPAWVRFNRDVADDGAVGIWHETYRVDEADYETVYRNMPPYGLGEVGELVPADGDRESMGGRFGDGASERTTETAPVAPDGSRR